MLPTLNDVRPEPVAPKPSTDPRVDALLQWADAVIEHIDVVLSTCVIPKENQL